MWGFCIQFERQTGFSWNTTCIDVVCRYYACKRILCLVSSRRKCEGFTEHGPSEVQKLVEQFVEDNVGVGKLWERQPHFTVNNHFVDEKLCH